MLCFLPYSKKGNEHIQFDPPAAFSQVLVWNIRSMSRSYRLTTAAGQCRKEAAVSYYLRVFFLWLKTWAGCHGVLLCRPPKMARAEHWLSPATIKHVINKIPIQRNSSRKETCGITSGVRLYKRINELRDGF